MGNDVPSSTGLLERKPKESGIREQIYLTIKRILDIICSGVALILLGPVILICALVIFLDDPHGSPFFSQTRVGKDGKEFRFYKLRSMVCNAEDLLNDLQAQNEMDGPAFKIKDDPRITRIGKFLRKSSIDELPQFLNVLKGDMSMVGPRPPLPREVQEYTPYQMQRLSVKPGLTCIWQIQPRRNDLSFDEWVELDMEYIQNRSFLLDLRLIVGTVKSMLGGEGR